MAATDYKTKYLDVRSKLLEATETSYRLGYEQGMKDAEVAQMQAEKQQQMEMEAAAAQGMVDPETGMPMEGGPPPEAGGEMPMGEEGAPPLPEGEEEAGSELDEHIAELESLVAKGEKPSVVDLRKKIEDLTSLRKTQKTEFSKKVQTNSTAQKSFVDSILKKWEKETKKQDDNLEEIIKQHAKTEE